MFHSEACFLESAFVSRVIRLSNRVRTSGMLEIPGRRVRRNPPFSLSILHFLYPFSDPLFFISISKARKLLDRTLIVVASEFSRDMMAEGNPEKEFHDQVEVPNRIKDPKHYGTHRHFSGTGCVLLFGGGVKKGHVHGVTDDERPCTTVKDPVNTAPSASRTKTTTTSSNARSASRPT